MVSSLLAFLDCIKKNSWAYVGTRLVCSNILDLHMAGLDLQSIACARNIIHPVVDHL